MKHIFLSIIIIFSSTHISAVLLSTARLLSGAIGLAYLGTSSIAWKDVRPMYCGIASAVISVLSYRHLYQTTPEGKLLRATIMLEQIKKVLLAEQTFSSEEVFLKTLHEVYIAYDLPLISAYEQLVTLLPIVHQAYQLLNDVAKHVADNDELAQQTDASLIQARRFIKNITTSIKWIRAHKDYLPQLKIYKQFIATQKVTSVQELIAASHQQIAFAQKSSTVLQWLQAIFGLF